MSGLPLITPWPPLITAASQPTWMLWRDRLLSFSMWVLLAILCRNALLLVGEEALFLSGLSDQRPAPDFREHMRRMLPFWITIGMLLLWLLGWGAVWVLSRKFTPLRPMPPALDPATEAARHGADPTDLLAWRDLPVAIVHVAEGGRMRAETPAPAGQPAADGPRM